MDQFCLEYSVFSSKTLASLIHDSINPFYRYVIAATQQEIIWINIVKLTYFKSLIEQETWKKKWRLNLSLFFSSTKKHWYILIHLQHVLMYLPLGRWTSLGHIISYPLFADADTGIYPHAAWQYHARPKAKRGIAMLSVDKFPYPPKQTRGNKFIPCSNNICDILKRFRSFKIPAITLIWPKSSYKHSVTRSYRSG